MPEIVTKSEFDEVGRQFSHSQSTLTSAWKSTLGLVFFMDRDIRDHQVSLRYTTDYPREINFERVVDGIRFQESGKHPTLFLGRIAWNTVAEINNAELSISDPNFIISWTEHIHKDFRNGEVRRARAAEHLAQAYVDLGRLASSVTE